MIRLFLWFVRGAAPRRLRQYLGLALLIAVAGLVELAALNALALFVTSLTALDQILVSRYAVWARRLLGNAFPADPRTLYLALGGGAVALVLLKNLLAALQTYCTARLDGAMNLDYGVRMLDGVMRLPYERIAGRNTAEVTRIISWRSCIGTLATGVMTILSDVVVTVLLLGSLLLVEPRLTLFAVLLLGGLGALAFLPVRRRILALGERSRRAVLALSRTVMHGVQGLREVKLFEAEDMVADAFRRDQRAEAGTRARSRVAERTPVWLFETLGMGGLVAGSIYLILSTDASSARIMGALSLLAIAAWRILPAMYRTVATLGAVHADLPSLEAVQSLVREIDADRRVRDAAGPATLPPFARDVVFEAVDFRYLEAEAPALSGLDLTVERGGYLGVVGDSGAGKSTLADLLVGLVAPTGGRILVDGAPLDDASRLAWRRQVGFVSQQPYLFDGTLAQNVAYSLDDRRIAPDRVRRCCELAGVLEFLPEATGLETPIGERGSRLSGGQAQRVAIARALYREPRLLVFDEATSALDDRNERTVHETIRALRGKVTVVVIAHRLRAVRDCDRVLWLRRGRVHRQGPPAEILPEYAARTRGPATEEDPA